MGNRSKYVVAGLLATLTISACGKTEKVVYLPATTVAETAPPATFASSATEEDLFIASVHRLYNDTIYVTDQEMLDAGYATCNMLRQGGTVQDIIDSANSAAAGDRDIYNLLAAVAAAAVGTLCPDQDYKFSDINA